MTDRAVGPKVETGFARSHREAVPDETNQGVNEVLKWQADGSTAEVVTFMEWWHSVNLVLRSRKQDDMLYGEAHARWEEIQQERA